MNKTTLKTIVLSALLALPIFAKAQTFAGITAEQSAQNTPEGWEAVQLPQLPAITSANTITVSGLSATDDNTAVIQAALNKVSSNDGGMVIVPAGTWVCGPLQINSKTILHLAKNCTLKLQPYGTYPNDKSNFIREKKNATDIVIEGEDKATSIIDGQGEAWWRALDAGAKVNRGAIIRFNSGSRFLVRNLTCKNAPGANITLGNKSANGNSSYRLNATVHDVNIYAPASELSKTGSIYPSHNTDGIPVWDPYINIYNCDISNGDDNVVCDSYAQYVHVWNCTFGTGHGASIGSYTTNVKHVWFDNITMNGTTAGIRMKTGMDFNDDKVTIKNLRGGGEEDWKFTNFTMTKVTNPFSIDCYYDKNYNSDPAVDEANARTLDSTTPTYNGILLQNVKTTDVCSGKAIFLVGRPESHIKNITLDNVQINAKTGIDIRFVDNLVFKNNSKITVSSGAIWLKKYASTCDDQCNATSSGTTVDDTKGPFTLNSKTLKDGTTTTATFSNGFSISNEKNKTYAVGSGTNYIKYSANQYTINIPDGIKISKIDIEGNDNYSDADAYISEINGTTYDATKYVFPKDKSVKKYTVEFSTPIEHSLTFTIKNKQCILAFTLYTDTTTGIAAITTDNSKVLADNNIYDLSGRVVAKNASANDLQGLSKGIYILNNKKFVTK